METTTLTNEQKKERPILFSTEMVQAILEGRKTQTRRIIKSRHESGLFAVSTAKYEPNCMGYYHNRCVDSLDWDERTVDGGGIICKHGDVGDILWVRETFVYRDKHNKFYYKADHTEAEPYAHNGWKPSIFMPRAACRLFLEITDVRIERLRDISEEDAIKEGVLHYKFCGSFSAYLYKDYSMETPGFAYAKPSFETLWKKINGEESWTANPWVWVIEFKTQQP